MERLAGGKRRASGMIAAPWETLAFGR